MIRTSWRPLLVGAVLLVGGTALSAQRGGGYPTEINNVPYDGRFTYARIKYTAVDMGRGGFRGRFDPMWNHDYPRSDRTFPQILSELSTIKARIDGSVVYTADDPLLHRFPVAYLCEVGSWMPSEAEVVGLRSYLVKGGFVIVDDFGGAQELDNFDRQLARVLPGTRRIRLDVSHPLFDTFYQITDLSFGEAFGRSAGPELYGIFQDNDPAKRLMMVVNYNYDISERWEWSFTGRDPLPTGDAFKLGINYVIYSFTH